MGTAVKLRAKASGKYVNQACLIHTGSLVSHSINAPRPSRCISNVETQLTGEVNLDYWKPYPSAYKELFRDGEAMAGW